MMTDLSPAAQAVLDAANASATNAWSDATHQRFRSGVAAALRAAADEVVPYDDLKGSDPDAWTRYDIRCELLVIAAELEAIQ